MTKSYVCIKIVKLGTKLDGLAKNGPKVRRMAALLLGAIVLIGMKYEL